MVVSRHRYQAEQITNLLKGAASRQLASDRLPPFASYAVEGERLPKILARGPWVVNLNSKELRPGQSVERRKAATTLGVCASGFRGKRSPLGRG